MRYTKKISVWPVGIVGGLKWEGPICKDGSVVKFYTLWKPQRPMPLDMAGFAINAKLIIDNPDVEMDTMAARGYLESSIVSRLATREEFEPLANNCKEVQCWWLTCIDLLLICEAICFISRSYKIKTKNKTRERDLGKRSSMIIIKKIGKKNNY